MLEYIFFHPTPFEKFVDFLKAKGQVPDTGSSDDGYEVRISEDIDDVLASEIEDRYDALMELNQALFESEQEASPDDYHAAGVVVNLNDGRAVYADVDPGLLARVMQALSPEEFGRIVTAIVDAVEEPDTRTFCQRMRDEEA